MRLAIPLAVLLFVLAGCGSSGQAAAHPAVPSAAAPQATPDTVSPPPPAPTDDGFRCARQSGGSATTSAALDLITAIRIGHQDGFDRFVIEYAGTGAVPTFEVTPQDSAYFPPPPPRVTATTLRGSAGVLVVVHHSMPARSYGTPPNELPNLKPNLDVLQEAGPLGDLEGDITWGLGVSGPACVRVTTLEHPTRLVVDLRR